MEHKVAEISDFPLASMKAVTIDDTPIVVFRRSNGEFAALVDRCSHAEVKLSRGTFDGEEVECPAHGARFEVCSGKHLCMPAVVDVATLPVLLRDGAVWVALN